MDGACGMDDGRVEVGGVSKDGPAGRLVEEISGLIYFPFGTYWSALGIMTFVSPARDDTPAAETKSETKAGKGRLPTICTCPMASQMCRNRLRGCSVRMHQMRTAMFAVNVDS